MGTSRFFAKKKTGAGAYMETHPFSIHEIEFEGDKAVVDRHICDFWVHDHAKAKRIARLLNQVQKVAINRQKDKDKITRLKARLKRGDDVQRMVVRELTAKVKLLEVELADTERMLYAARRDIEEANRKSREDIEARIAASTGSDPGDDPDYAGY